MRMIYHEGSGSYGRMSTDDGGEDAALLSRAVGAPVRVQWSREDEHGWAPKGPAQFDEVKAALDGDGKWIAWDFADYSLPWTEAGRRRCWRRCKSASDRPIPAAPMALRAAARSTASAINGFSPITSIGILPNRFRCAPAICAPPAISRAVSPPNVCR